MTYKDIKPEKMLHLGLNSFTCAHARCKSKISTRDENPVHKGWVHHHEGWFCPLCAVGRCKKYVKDSFEEKV